MPSTFFVLQKSRVLTSKQLHSQFAKSKGKKTYYVSFFVNVDSLAMSITSIINTLPLDGEWLPFSSVGVNTGQRKESH